MASVYVVEKWKFYMAAIEHFPNLFEICFYSCKKCQGISDEHKYRGSSWKVITGFITTNLEVLCMALCMCVHTMDVEDILCHHPG